MDCGDFRYAPLRGMSDPVEPDWESFKIDDELYSGIDESDAMDVAPEIVKNPLLSEEEIQRFVHRFYSDKSGLNSDEYVQLVQSLSLSSNPEFQSHLEAIFGYFSTLSSEDYSALFIRLHHAEHEAAAAHFLVRSNREQMQALLAYLSSTNMTTEQTKVYEKFFAIHRPEMALWQCIQHFIEDPFDLLLTLFGKEELREDIGTKLGIWLKNLENSGIALDAKLFAHVFGDSFITNSNWEGLPVQDTLNYLIRVLEYSKYDDTLDALLGDFREIQEWEKAVSGVTLPYHLEEYGERLQAIGKRVVAKLQSQGRAVLPGGWHVSYSTGHALIYEIERESSGLYKFSIYNSGAGLLSYHTSKYRQRRLKYYPLFSLSNIQPKDIEKPEVFHRLLAFQTAGRLKAGAETEHDIYQLLFLLFPQAVLDDYSSVSHGKLMSPQVSGICSYECLIAYMRIKLPLQKFLQTKFAIRFTTLSLWYLGLQKQNEISADISFLTEKTLQRFSVAIRKNLKRPSVFAHEQLMVCSALIERLKSFNYDSRPRLVMPAPRQTEELFPFAKSLVSKKISRAVVSPCLDRNETVYYEPGALGRLSLDAEGHLSLTHIVHYIEWNKRPLPGRPHVLRGIAEVCQLEIWTALRPGKVTLEHFADITKIQQRLHSVKENAFLNPREVMLSLYLHAILIVLTRKYLEQQYGNDVIFDIDLASPEIKTLFTLGYGGFAFLSVEDRNRFRELTAFFSSENARPKKLFTGWDEKEAVWSISLDDMDGAFSLCERFLAKERDQPDPLASRLPIAEGKEGLLYLIQAFYLENHALSPFFKSWLLLCTGVLSIHLDLQQDGILSRDETVAIRFASSVGPNLIRKKFQLYLQDFKTRAAPARRSPYLQFAEFIMKFQMDLGLLFDESQREQFKSFLFDFISMETLDGERSTLTTFLEFEVEAQDQSSALPRLLNLLSAVRDLALKNARMEVILFLMELDTSLAEISDVQRIITPDHFPLIEHKGSIHQQIACGRYFLELFKEKVDWKFVKLLFYLLALARTKEDDPWESSELCQISRNSKEAVLELFLATRAEEVVTHLNESFAHFHLQFSSPLHVDTDKMVVSSGKIAFHILTGELLVGGELLQCLPENVLALDIFRELNPDRELLDFEPTAQGFKNSSSGIFLEHLRFKGANTSTLSLLLTPESLLKRIRQTIPEVEIEIFGKLNKFLYCSNVRSSPLYEQAFTDLFNDLPNTLRCTLRYEHWLGCRSTHPEMFIIDRQKKRLMKVTFASKFSTILNLATGELLANRVSIEGFFIPVRGSHLTWLSDFEDLRKALLWQNNVGNFTSVELPRLGLTFHFSTKSFCDQYPGYSVCYEQECPIPNTRSCIYLRDAVDNELVLMPVYPFRIGQNLQNSSTRQFGADLEGHGLQGNFFGHYAYFRGVNEKFFSGTNEAILHLARLLTLSLDYGQALEYLNRSFSALEPSEKYVAKLQEFLNPDSYKARTTELYAVLMHAFCLLLDLTNSIDVAHAQVIYSQYVSHYNHLNYRLSVIQEIKITTFFYDLANQRGKEWHKKFYDLICHPHAVYLKNKKAPWPQRKSSVPQFFWPSRWQTDLESTHNPCKTFGITFSRFTKSKHAGINMYTQLGSESISRYRWEEVKVNFAHKLLQALKSEDHGSLWDLRIDLFKFFYALVARQAYSGQSRDLEKFTCVAMLLLTENFLDPHFYAEHRNKVLKSIPKPIDTDRLPDLIDHYWPLLVQKQQEKLALAPKTREVVMLGDASEMALLATMPVTLSPWPRIASTIFRFGSAANELQKQQNRENFSLPGSEKIFSGLSTEEKTLESAVKRSKQFQFQTEADCALFEDIITDLFVSVPVDNPPFALRENEVAVSVAAQALFRKIFDRLEEDVAHSTANTRRFALKQSLHIESLKGLLEEFQQLFEQESEGLKQSMQSDLINVDTCRLQRAEAFAFELMRDKKITGCSGLEEAIDWYAFAQSPHRLGLEHLYTLVHDYMIAVNRVLALKQALAKIAELEICPDEQKTHIQNELVQIIASPLFFAKVVLDPLVLYFQYKTGKILRPKQLTFFSRAVTGGRDVFQLGCGEGKTKILTVLIALYLSKQKKLVVNVVPSANFIANYRDLQEQYRDLIDNSVTVLKFSRNQALTFKNIYLYERKLAASLETHGVVITEPQTLQALQLKYLENLYKLPNSPDGQTRQYFGLYDKILGYLMLNGAAIVDEVHQVFDPLKDLNYSLNDAMVLSAFRFEIPGVLIRLAFEMPSLSRGFSGVQVESSGERSLFITELARAVASRPFDLYLDIKECDQETLFDYLTFERARVDPASHLSRDKLIRWHSSLTLQTQEKIALIRAHLHVYLPHCMNLRCHVDYGRSEEKDFRFAVPYKANMRPAENSRFECIETLVNCTYLLYLKDGLSKEQTAELVQSWQLQDREVATNQTFSGQTSAASQKFSRKWNKQPLSSVDTSDSGLIDELHQFFAKDTEFIIEYLETKVFSEINIQAYKLSSNAQDVARTLFPRVIGLSGTPGNFLTYPVEMQLHHDREANGEMLNLLINPAVCSLEIHPEISIAALTQSSSTCLILDPAAYFEGRTNEELANEVLKGSCDKVRAVLYFATQSNRLTLKFKDGVEQPFQAQACAIEERVTYLDQEHVTGVDVVQPVQGVGYLIVHKGLKITDFFQSAKRLRGLGKGQRLALVVPENLCKTITQLTGHKKITQETIILWTIINEATELGCLILPALLDQIHNIYRTKAFKTLVEVKDIIAKRALLQKYKNLLMTKINHEAFLEHSSLDPKEAPVALVMASLKRYEEEYSDLLDDEMRQNLFAVQTRAEQLLPSQLVEFSEVSLDVVAQQEQEGEVEVKTQIEIQRKVYKEAVWDPKLHLEHLMSLGTGQFQDDVFQSVDKTRSVFVASLALSLPAVGFSSKIFMTENFLSGIAPCDPSDQAGFGLFLKSLEQIKFLAVIYQVNRGVDFSRYLILSSDEAGVLRERLLNRKINLLPTQEISLYDIKGNYWGGLHKQHDDQERVLVLSQLQYLNGETQFSETSEPLLANWIYSEKFFEKISFFHTRRKHLAKSVFRPAFEGSMLQRVFRRQAEYTRYTDGDKT